ncbi:hypothetical protein OAL17_00605 [bacterium]|nr:hypothetical protein [bacterium]MDC0307435.1 hypothetical protein [bacterium]
MKDLLLTTIAAVLLVGCGAGEGINRGLCFHFSSNNHPSSEGTE